MGRCGSLRMHGEPAIFISYRRRDGSGHGRALHEYLSRRFGEDSVFFDRSTIESGDVFPDALRQGVEKCAVLLALIGPEWLDVRGDDDDGRRLDDANDFVHREIALALEQGKKVIPVLFDDTPVPPRDRLPDPLKPLASCDALTLRGKTYEYQTQRRELVQLLAKVPGVPQPQEEAVGVARFIPWFLFTLLHLSFKPYTTAFRVVRDSDPTDACLYFFLCVGLTQLLRFRIFSDFYEIAKIGTVDIGWKIVAVMLVIGYLWLIAFTSKKPDLTRLSVFVAFVFGTFSIVFQFVLIFVAGLINAGNNIFGECVGQVASYTAPRIVNTAKCKELASNYPFLYSLFTEWVVSIIFTILALIPVMFLWALWAYKTMMAYIDIFLIGKRRWLGILVLIISFPALMYVIINIRSSFLERAIKI